MKKIKSFTVDHDLIGKGIFLSRTDRNTYTFDLRLAVPNRESVKPEALHTLEHLGATYLRNSAFSDSVVYFGPMGCLTGCYAVFFDDISYADAIKLIRDAFEFASDFEGKIPGAERRECGNYLFHDLDEAKKTARAFLEATNGWDEKRLAYPSK